MGRPTAIPQGEYLLLTLLILDKESMGRYNLATYLQLTKAKTRSVLEYLILHGLAEANPGRGGTQLTPKAHDLLKIIHSHVMLSWSDNLVRVDLDGNLIPSDCEYAICIVRTDDKDTHGLYERDLAVRAGARGAITLKSSDKKWVYPGIEEEIEPPELRDVDPATHQYDLMIISFGPSLGSVYTALANIILYHCEDILDYLPVS
ncbi:MAG: DUF4443 domain-containing protein [Candidatus Kariarchaeaceae archaeon]